MEPKTIEQSVEIIAKAVEVLPAMEKSIKTAEERLKELEMEYIKIKSSGLPISEKEDKMERINKRVAIVKALQTGRNDDVKKAVLETGLKTKAINETGGTGSGQLGYSIPEEWSTDISQAIYTYGRLASQSKRIPMNRLIMNDYEYVNGLSANFITTAGTAITSSVPSAVSHVLTAKEISVLTIYDAAFLADATPETLRVIEEDAARALAARLEYAIVSGSGSADATNGGITGLLNAAVNVVTAAATAGSTFTTALTVANINSLIEAIPYTTQGKNMAFVGHKSLRSVLRGLTGAPGGGYIWSPGEKGDVDYIYSYPCIWLEGDSISSLSETTTSAKFFAFGDVGSIRIGDRQDVSIAVSDQWLFNQNQVAVRWIMRADAWVQGKMWAVLQTGAGA